MLMRMTTTTLMMMSKIHLGALAPLLDRHRDKCDLSLWLHWDEQVFLRLVLEGITFGLVCFPGGSWNLSWDIFASGQFWSRGVLRSHGQSLSILASGKEDVCVIKYHAYMKMMIMISMVVIMIHLALGLEVFINHFTLLRDIEIRPLQKVSKLLVKLKI